MMRSQRTEYFGEVTEACLLDRLKQHLASIERGEGVYANRGYYNQAHVLLKICAYNFVFRVLKVQLETEAPSIHGKREDTKTYANNLTFLNAF